MSSGQSVQHRVRHRRPPRPAAFSPLVVGAIGATYEPGDGFNKIRRSFQSPCRRGNRCNWLQERPDAQFTRPFSPLVVGAIGATSGWRGSSGGVYYLSVPLSSGQSVQPRGGVGINLACSTLSVPLSSGQSVQRRTLAPETVRKADFQSPCRRGNRCNNAGGSSCGAASAAFSPLVVGAIGATLHQKPGPQMVLGFFQSPCRRGNRCNCSSASLSIESPELFQSPCRRGNRCNTHIHRKSTGC